MFSWRLPISTSTIAKIFPRGARAPHELRAGTSRFLAQKVFIWYNGIVSLYFLFWCIWWPLVDKLRVTLYLAYWTWYITTVYFLVSLFSAVLCQIAIERERPRAPAPRLDPPPMETAERITEPPVPSFFRWVQHVTWNISLVFSFVVITVYFVGLYEGGPLTSSTDINAHIAIGAIMLFDMYFVASEYRCTDYWYSEYFGIIYLIFNLIYYYEGPPAQRLIYPILDWEKDTGTATLYVFIILFGLIPAFAMGLYVVFLLRELMYFSCLDGKEMKSKSKKQPKQAAAAAPITVVLEPATTVVAPVPASAPTAQV